MKRKISIPIGDIFELVIGANLVPWGRGAEILPAHIVLQQYRCCPVPFESVLVSADKFRSGPAPGSALLWSELGGTASSEKWCIRRGANFGDALGYSFQLGQEQTHDLNTSCAELAFSRGSNRLNQFAHCFPSPDRRSLVPGARECLASSPSAAGIPLPPATSSGALVCGQQVLTSSSPTEEAVQKTQAKAEGQSGVSRYRVKEFYGVWQRRAADSGAGDWVEVSIPARPQPAPVAITHAAEKEHKGVA
ncbi:hypothetical protein WISP_142723 [Willisornis vidua]|uniref:Uncharacterized protein n=1 Tax=Willisornis vidua TaxID=1566151 RepID=A0ABQ9CS81_9PASS|nr:hypothetical protein WISP_142723 [Willisornis vidua]